MYDDYDSELKSRSEYETSGVDAVPPEAKIPSWVEQATDRLANLHRELDVLTDRLAAVLTAPRPSEVQKAAPSSPETSSLAEQIHALSDGATSASKRVRDLIVRLDL